MLWKILLEAILLVVAVPLGYLISQNTKDELKDGKKWFIAVFAISFFLGIFFLIQKNAAIYLSLFFAMIVSGISYLQSLKHNKL